jgi:hypothetical protein
MKRCIAILVMFLWGLVLAPPAGALILDGTGPLEYKFDFSSGYYPDPPYEGFNIQIDFRKLSSTGVLYFDSEIWHKQEVLLWWFGSDSSGTLKTQFDQVDFPEKGTVPGLFTISLSVEPGNRIDLLSVSMSMFDFEPATVPGGYYDLVTTSWQEGSPVPEPTTLLLLGSGLLGVIGYGRKRFKKS